MNPNTYQEATEVTEIYSDAAKRFTDKILSDEHNPEVSQNMLSMMYCTGKLNGEAGEVAELVFKAFRTGELTDEDKDKLFLELGDVQWYIARIAALCNFTLSDIMLANIEKLQSRAERGVIHGHGSDR